MQSQMTPRADEAGTEYRYQYEYEQASYLEIYSHSLGHSAGQNGHDWRLHPLNLTVGPEIARQFHWKAETGTIYTYEHGLTSRYIHLDRITRQFCDQQRNPLSVERALAHAMPQAISQAAPRTESQTELLPGQALAVQQPLPRHSLTGHWKSASALSELGELSLSSFLRRVDYEAHQDHQRFAASAMEFIQQSIPPGASALVRIYRRLTMKSSQIAPTAPADTAASQFFAESAPVPRPAHHAGGLNVAAFTRRAA